MPDEVLLTNPEEVLYRQVNPAFLVEGEFSSQIFEVTPKDHGELSVDQHRLTSAQEAYDRFVEQGYRSVGVTHVTVDECSSVDLQCYDKPEPWNPAHGFIDFRKISARAERKKKARRLKLMAERRGWDYKPNDSSGG